jgi:hypothetical protein
MVGHTIIHFVCRVIKFGNTTIYSIWSPEITISIGEDSYKSTMSHCTQYHVITSPQSPTLNASPSIGIPKSQTLVHTLSAASSFLGILPYTHYDGQKLPPALMKIPLTLQFAIVLNMTLREVHRVHTYCTSLQRNFRISNRSPYYHSLCLQRLQHHSHCHIPSRKSLINPKPCWRFR